MRVADFSFDLPDQLIARYPLAQRSASRLLHLCGATGALTHGQFIDVLDYVNPQDLLVFNNTKVIPARLFAQKISGGKLEILLERILDTHTIVAHVRASKALPVGAQVVLSDTVRAEMLGREGSLFKLRFTEPVLPVLERLGHMPLPPYIDRADEALDRERYQTVYASELGAVAAPTAGLHFDQNLLDALSAKGVAQTFVTLHVGAGTFQPVRVEKVADHVMHHEWLEVNAATVAAVKACQARGGRVIAVGTTSVRALESATLTGEMQPYCGDTNIFLYPGKAFRVVDVLLTNFHLPESTLLMLVSAFAGYSETMQAYEEAIAHKYRFFSYGDAMFITKNLTPCLPKENL